MNVFIIMAMTADGFIAQDHIQPTSWTSQEDKQHFRSLTKEAGVVIMGSNTYKTLNKAMRERRTIVYTRHPEAITAEDVEVTSEAPQELIKRLGQEGYVKVALIGGANLNSQFLAAGVVDELYLTIEPMLWGQGISLLDKAAQQPLRLIDVSRLNESTILLHYELPKTG